MSSVGEEFPREQARIRRAIQIYRELPGGVGNIGAMLMEDTLRRADAAMASGDVVQIIRAYQEMKETADDIGHGD